MNDLKVKHGDAPWPIEGTPICTKRSADVRFSQYSENLWLLRTACAGKDNRVLCKVYHLAEGDRLTHVLAAVCKRDYDPAVDIDRYLVDCFGSHGRLDLCPVFEAIRAALENERARRVNLRNDAVDDARCADVGYGDGYVGPILDVFNFTGWSDGGEDVYRTTFGPEEVKMVSRTAVFTRSGQKHTVTVAVSPQNAGNVSGSGQYDDGDTCTVSASGKCSPWKFVRWVLSTGETSSDREYQFTVHSDVVATAVFSHTNTGLPYDQGGKILCSSSGDVLYDGDAV